MAIGDTQDMLARLRAVLPPWFPNQGSAPVLDGILSGIASVLSGSYGLIQYARAQSRIATATGAWLDLIAWDFFGSRFQRRTGEPDAQFSPRIQAELIRPRQTRAAIIQMAEDLTGFQPSIIEAFNPQDLGGFDTGGLAFDARGGFGATNQNNQLWVTAFRPVNYGIGYPAAGFDAGPGGYDAGLLGLLDPAELPSAVTDAEIANRIRETVAAGIALIINVISPPPDQFWDDPDMTWDMPGVVWPA